jgi:acyl carrier protein
MADDDVLDAVRSCSVEVLQVRPERVTLDALFVDDLGASSLTVVEVVMALEEVFGFEAPEEDVSSIRTVADACDLVRRLS